MAARAEARRREVPVANPWRNRGELNADGRGAASWPTPTRNESVVALQFLLHADLRSLERQRGLISSSGFPHADEQFFAIVRLAARRYHRSLSDAQRFLQKGRSGKVPTGS